MHKVINGIASILVPLNMVQNVTEITLGSVFCHFYNQLKPINLKVLRLLRG